MRYFTLSVSYYFFPVPRVQLNGDLVTCQGLGSSARLAAMTLNSTGLELGLNCLEC